MKQMYSHNGLCLQCVTTVAEMRASASASAATVTAVASHLSWIAHPGAASLSGLCTVKQTPMIATAGSDGTLRLWTLSHIQVSAI
jgi:hypothetical protein